jgi:hypothetical protein
LPNYCRGIGSNQICERPPDRLICNRRGTRRGLTLEAIAEPEERLSVKGQITFLEEAASALKDDCLGFTLARDHDPREVGLLYYVMASSRTLGEALQRLARYSKVTNEALAFGYREGNQLIINLSYSGVPRHSDRHQMEFCMFAAIRICRLLTGQKLVPQHFSIAHHRSGNNAEMSRFVGTGSGSIKLPIPVWS